MLYKLSTIELPLFQRAMVLGKLPVPGAMVGWCDGAG